MKHEWSDAGAIPVRGARRNCCRWNDAENVDLKAEWAAGWTMPKIAQHHGRTWNGVETQLCRLLHCGVDELASRRRPVISRTSFTHWYSKDGRVFVVEQMDLDHALNTMHDCNFRVAQMKKRSIDGLGGKSNRNVRPETFGAFCVVTSADVFPAYAAIVDYVKSKFRHTYGVELRDVRKAVYGAWANGTHVPVEMREAVEFLLHAGKTHAPARFGQYLDTFNLVDARSLHAMCWNLRIDTLCAIKLMGVYGNSPVRHLSPSHTAFRFVTPSASLDENWDYADDIPFQ